MGSVEAADQSWFALQVKPRHEKTAAAALKSKGFEELLPLYTSVRRWSDRVKTLEEPLFPRYVFCRFGLREKMAVVATPGVMSIVGMGKIPAPVEPEEIIALQVLMQSGAAAVPWPFLRAGQMLRIEDGPLYGLEGILLQCQGRSRLVVSVTLLQRSVAVELERHWVTPIGPAPRPPARALVPSLFTRNQIRLTVR